jgi:hypothetical protein
MVELTVNSVSYIVHFPTDGDSVVIHISVMGKERWHCLFTAALAFGSFCAQPWRLHEAVVASAGRIISLRLIPP